MTLGYAMDQEWGQHLDIELFEDIQFELEDIKSGVVSGWLGTSSLPLNASPVTTYIAQNLGDRFSLLHSLNFHWQSQPELM